MKRMKNVKFKTLNVKDVYDRKTEMYIKIKIKKLIIN